MIQNTQRISQSPMLYALGVLPNSACQDINLDADQVYDTLIGMISPHGLQSAVIGQYNNVKMDIS